MMLQFQSFLSFLKNLKFILGTLLIVTFIIIFYSFSVGWVSLTWLLTILNDKSALGPIIFLVVYTILTISSVPTLPLNLAAGFLWGWFPGAIFTVMGASSGAVLTFFTSRYLFKNIFLEKFKGPGWVELDKGIKQNEWKVILFTRLNPAFPFGLTNWFFGLSQVSVFRFSVGTILGIFPGAVIFSILGSSVGQLMLTNSQRDIYVKIVIAFAIVTLIVFLVFFKKYIYAFIKGKF